MTEIEITPMEEDTYGVQVREGDTTSSHRVRIPERLVDDLQLGDQDGERLIRESFEFLLEREPATSILREFSLEQIGDYFPEYPDEIRHRLGEVREA